MNALEPTPTPQATPDELATIYLRARDVSCPGCGYNRRDGQTTICPECDVYIRIRIEDPHTVQFGTRRASILAAFMLIVATLCTLYYGVETYSTFDSYLTFGGWSMTLFVFVIANGVAALLFATAVVWTARFLVPRSKHKLGNRLATSGLICCLAALPDLFLSVWYFSYWLLN